jgi:hypothetical protein
MVELFDGGKADIDLRLAGGTPCGDQLWQPVQGLRAEHHIDVGRAFDDGRALLAGDTAADTDDQLGIVQFEFAHAAEVVKDFFLGFFAYRTGVEQDDIGGGGIVGGGQAFTGMQ